MGRNQVYIGRLLCACLLEYAIVTMCRESFILTHILVPHPRPHFHPHPIAPAALQDHSAPAASPEPGRHVDGGDSQSAANAVRSTWRGGLSEYRGMRVRASVCVPKSKIKSITSPDDPLAYASCMNTQPRICAGIVSGCASSLRGQGGGECRAVPSVVLPPESGC